MEGKVQASIMCIISDQVNQGNLDVMYCPTDERIGDFMTKPLQGSKFVKFQKAIMGG